MNVTTGEVSSIPYTAQEEAEADAAELVHQRAAIAEEKQKEVERKKSEQLQKLAEKLASDPSILDRIK